MPRSFVLRGSLAAALLAILVGATAVSPPPAAAAETETITLGASEATYVSSTEPSRNFASAPGLLATSTIYRTLVKFDTTQLVGRDVLEARLSLKTQQIATTQPGIVVRATGDAWSAGSVTHQTRPATGATLSSGVQATGGTTSVLPLSLANVAAVDSATSFDVTYSAPSSGFVIAKDSPLLSVTVRAGTANPTSPPPASSAPQSAPATGPLPFVPSASGKKKVFAHYFTPYPLSLDNQAPTNDYYARNYLSPGGESGKFLAAGGLLRDRPIPRDPVAGDWRAADMRTEVRQAMDAGIDGFAVDLLALSGTHYDNTVRMLTAARDTSANFKIMLQPDMTSSTGSADVATMAAKLAELSRYPSVYRDSAGRVVVSPFKAEAKTPDWWKSVLAEMKAKHGVDAVLFPLFLDAATNMAKFAPISVGFSEWGMRDPGGIAARADNAGAAHQLGRQWMAPIAVQDVRFVGAIYDEAANTEALRTSWERAISDDADLALIPTWNDYSEASSIAPSVDHGYALLDLSAYYASRFHSGGYPQLTGDALSVSHRTHDYRMVPTQQTTLARLRASRTPARNTVEVVSLLTSPATVTVQIGATRQSYQAPSGLSARTFPLAVGSVSASATRGSSTVASVVSPHAVVASAAQQDLSYHAATSRRAAPRER